MGAVGDPGGDGGPSVREGGRGGRLAVTAVFSCADASAGLELRGSALCRPLRVDLLIGTGERARPRARGAAALQAWQGAAGAACGLVRPTLWIKLLPTPFPSHLRLPCAPEPEPRRRGRWTSCVRRERGVVGKP